MFPAIANGFSLSIVFSRFRLGGGGGTGESQGTDLCAPSQRKCFQNIECGGRRIVEDAKGADSSFEELSKLPFWGDQEWACLRAFFLPATN